MKVNFTVFFDYHLNPDNEIDEAVSDLLMNFVDFCEFTDFKVQCIPRIGEKIVAEDLIHKWIGNEEYKKPFSSSQIWKIFNDVLKSTTFKVFDIYHSLDSCSIHCSDMEDQEIK